MTSRTIMTI